MKKNKETTKNRVSNRDKPRDRLVSAVVPRCAFSPPYHQVRT
jgi:hypothetical protein